MAKTRVLDIDDCNFQEEIHGKSSQFFVILSKSQSNEGKN